MIDHLTLTVRDMRRSRPFYEAVLAPLGYRVLMEFEGMCGFGDARKPYLWMKQGDPPSSPMHLAFAAARRRDVDAFHAAALGCGARDNGAPGVRAHYHPTYYGAFALDPDGHPIEAVCHREEVAGGKRSAGGTRTAPKARRKAKPKAAARTAPKRIAGRAGGRAAKARR
jgi:catechol 2,3-dioxygenase-like lactoylglutathione lyase family enzyme